MKPFALRLAMITIAFAVAAATSRVQAGPPGPSAAGGAGSEAFVEVARVLQSPRCKNCHPSGDAPLQGDVGKPHAMNITRASIEAGLACSTCHQERNSEALGIKGGPPGAPHWNLPSKETPMVFEGKTESALCEQLKTPAQTGGRSLAQLLDHVTHDPLVLWGWAPGGKRTVPPIAHERFVAAFSAWVSSGAPCPPP
jgi:hypothetical protein